MLTTGILLFFTVAAIVITSVVMIRSRRRETIYFGLSGIPLVALIVLHAVHQSFGYWVAALLVVIAGGSCIVALLGVYLAVVSNRRGRNRIPLILAILLAILPAVLISGGVAVE